VRDLLGLERLAPPREFPEDRKEHEPAIKRRADRAWGPVRRAQPGQRGGARRCARAGGGGDGRQLRPARRL